MPPIFDDLFAHPQPTPRPAIPTPTPRPTIPIPTPRPATPTPTPRPFRAADYLDHPQPTPRPAIPTPTPRPIIDADIAAVEMAPQVAGPQLSAPVSDADIAAVALPDAGVPGPGPGPAGAISDADIAVLEPAPDAAPGERGFLDNTVRGIGESGLGLVGGMGLSGALLASTEFEDVQAEHDIARAALDPEQQAEFDQIVGGLPGANENKREATADVGREWKRRMDNVDLGYDVQTTWEDFKSAPLSKAAPFIAEHGLVSLPHMAAALANPMLYGTALSGQMADARAKNDFREDATVEDLLKAAPGALTMALMERFGARGAIGLDDAAVTAVTELPKAAGKAAVKEAGTEFAQESVQYATETAGTETGFDKDEMLEAGLQGAVVGGGVGGAVRTGTGAAELAVNAGNRPAPDSTPAPAPVRRVSPGTIRDTDIAQIEPETETGPEVTQNPDPENSVTSIPTKRAGDTPVNISGRIDPIAPFNPEPTRQQTAITNPSAARANAQPGSERVITPDGNVEVDTDFEVVDLDTLKSAEGQLQPRDRAGRVGSDDQIRNIAANLDPQRLMSSRESDRGSPIIDDENVVLSGNGRTAAIARAAEQHPDRYAAYRQQIAALGYDVEGVKTPVLVRRAKNLSPEQKRAFAVQTLARADMELSPSERARVDQDHISTEMLNSFNSDVEGGVSAAGNGAFVREFMRRIPQSEHNALIDKDGVLTEAGQRRMTAALFARAYGDKRLVERAVEQGADKAITNALQGASAAWARMRDALKQAGKEKQFDITGKLVEALQIVEQARSKGQNLDTYLSQSDAFRQLDQDAIDVARLFYNEQGTRLAAWRDMRDRLNDYAEQATRLTQAGDDFFGGGPADGKQIVAAIAGKMKRKGEEQVKAGLAQPPLPVAAKTAPSTLLDADPDPDLFDVSEDFGSRVSSGTLTPGMEQVSFTNERSIYEEAFRAAGIDPDRGVNLPPKRKMAVLKNLLEKTFGLKVDLRGISPFEANNQMLDAYRGVRYMNHVLDLPNTATGLNGKLSVVLEKYKGRYLGAYDPTARAIHMPGRSNSFAHEWMHALDHALVEAFKPNSKYPLWSQAARNEGVDPTQNVDAAFVNLLNTMFYEDAALAAKIMELETKAQQVAKRGPNIGQPTAAAKEARDQIDRVLAGNSRLRIKPSSFRENSAGYSPSQADYYASAHEMIARAFEAYIAHKVDLAGGGNAFITKGERAYLSDADARLAKTFPKLNERAKIFAAFEHLFHHVRTSAILGTEPGASRPADTDIADPSRWFKAAGDMEPGLLKEMTAEAHRAKNVVKNFYDNPAKASAAAVETFARNLGFSKDEAVAAQAMQRFADFGRHVVWSGAGVMRSLAKRNKGHGGEFMEFLIDKLTPDIGTGKEQAVNFDEERERFGARATLRAEAVLKGNGFRGLKLSKADNDIVRDLMFGKNVPASENLVRVAAEFRRIMEDGYAYAKQAGLDIGYVTDKGYLPRVIHSDAVRDDMSGFAQDAAEVYRVVFDRIVARLQGDEAADAALELAGIYTPGQFNAASGPFGKEVKALRAARRALNKARNQQQPDQNAIQQAQDDVQSATDDLFAVLRDPYAERSADDWARRISIGDASTYDTHGPLASFTKERKLPSEADDILAKWYNSDVIDLTVNYAFQVGARAAYHKRFGAGSTIRLNDVLRRKEVRRALENNPKKYNPKTAAGQMNILRDLTNPRADNILEIALALASDHGAHGADLIELRRVIERLTGRGDQVTVSSWVDVPLQGLYAFTYITLLPRAMWTSVAEPVATLMRTGDVKTMFRTFGRLAMEAARGAKSTKEISEFANMIGLVSNQLHDQIALNRMNGDFHSGRPSGSMHLLARFFRMNGLTQLTNAQRRATMAAGFYWLRDMANQLKNPETDKAKQEIVRAEFRDLGVPDAHIDAMADWLTQSDQHPTVEDLNSPAGRIYADAISRYVDQTIQNPRRADKPLNAAGPLGRLVYALTSFLYAFFRNVHIANWKRAARNYSISRDVGNSKARATWDAAHPVAMSLGAGFTSMFLAQALVSIVREALFSPEQWEEKKKDDELAGWIGGLAFSRTGAFGPADLVFQAITGLRYERDLSSLLVGPGIGMVTSHIQNIVNGMPQAQLYDGGLGVGLRNNPNTNTAEHTALKSVYKLAVAPALSAGLAALPAPGPVGWGARYTALTLGTSNAAATSFADAVAGEKSKGKESRNPFSGAKNNPFSGGDKNPFAGSANRPF